MAIHPAATENTIRLLDGQQSELEPSQRSGDIFGRAGSGE
jgi:hypothetical protein